MRPSLATFDGVLVAQFAERRAAAFGDLGGVGEGFGVVPEEAGEFGGGLEVPFGVGLEAPAGVVDGAVLADAGERVVEAAARGVVLVDVAGGDEGEAVRGGEPGEMGEAVVVLVGGRGHVSPGEMAFSLGRASASPVSKSPAGTPAMRKAKAPSSRKQSSTSATTAIWMEKAMCGC